MFAVYILQSVKTKVFYKGQSSELEVRLDRHLNGKSSTTKKMLPLRLIHAEFCISRSQARTLEKYFKSGFGREIIKEIAEERS